MNSTGRQYPLVLGTIFHRGHEGNTMRDTTPPMYLTRTGIRSKSSIKASDGTSHRQGMVADIGDRWMTSSHSRETTRAGLAQGLTAYQRLLARRRRRAFRRNRRAFGRLPFAL